MTVRVVVVEDEHWLAEQYLRTLRRAGYESYHAAHALGAIDLIDDVRPSVIVLDMLLTGASALALLHELQSHVDLAKIPIILATNLTDQISLEDVASYGVKRLLNKTTMHPDDIAVAVRACL